jgi:hypothetical protein
MLSKRGAEATRATKGTSFVVPPPRQTPPAGGRGKGLGQRASRLRLARLRQGRGCAPSQVDLKKWLELMDSYEAGGFMYHATMPTDALATFRDVMLETKEFGFDNAKDSAVALGGQVLETKDFGAAPSPSPFTLHPMTRPPGTRSPRRGR